MIALRRFYVDGVPGPGHLLIEGGIGAVLGTAFAAWMFPDETSLVAIFLAALLGSDSVERLLEWNRWSIQKRQVLPRRANGRLALRLVFLFAGSFIGFGALGMGLPEDRVGAMFSHQLRGTAGGSLPDLVFAPFSELLLHNLYVLVFFFLIALPFRRGGVMLAIAWNSSAWGLISATLARGWAGADRGLLSAWGQVMTVVSPHLFMEATAYVLAGLAGVFVSKAAEKHALDSDVMFGVARAVGWLFALAVALVAVGALVEATLAPAMVVWVAGR